MGNIKDSKKKGNKLPPINDKIVTDPNLIKTSYPTNWCSQVEGEKYPNYGKKLT